MLIELAQSWKATAIHLRPLTPSIIQNRATLFRVLTLTNWCFARRGLNRSHINSNFWFYNSGIKMFLPDFIFFNEPHVD